jgi:hypothetical protein
MAAYVSYPRYIYPDQTNPSRAFIFQSGSVIGISGTLGWSLVSDWSNPDCANNGTCQSPPLATDNAPVRQPLDLLVQYTYAAQDDSTQTISFTVDMALTKGYDYPSIFSG